MTEQLEKVCNGLECCVLRDPDDHRRCGECPYNPHAISNEPCANGLKFNALALIRQQQERIKELEAAQQWISVKDRLPDNEQDVLAYLDNGEETRIAPCNYANGVWFDCVMNCAVVLRHVTHWMPLPEPPKEG